MATINQNCKRTKLANASSILALIAQKIIKLYQLILSPVLHSLSMSTIVGGCRFYPSCSEYSLQAIKHYGFNFTSIKLILSRLLRCRPFLLFKNKKKYNGYDPINTKDSEDSKYKTDLK